MRFHEERPVFVDGPEKKRGGCLVTLVLTLAALICAGFVLNSAMNRNVKLSSEKVGVLTLNKSYEGFTVLFLSDLHAQDIGSDTAQWNKLLFGKNWHAAVLGGDMVGSRGDYEPLLSLIHILKQMKPDAPIYFIAGDDDPDPILSSAHASAQVYNEWVTAAVQAGGIYLDAPVCQEFSKKNVWFVPMYLYDTDTAGMAATLDSLKTQMEQDGRQYTADGGAAYRAVCARLEAMQRSTDAIRQIQSGDLQIAVNHTPLEADYIRENLEWSNRKDIFSLRSVSLLMCSHLCGGQWCLPGGMPLYIPDWGLFPGSGNVKGMQRLNSLNFYISPGLGASEKHPLPGRVFNAPGATLLKFTAAVQ